MSTETHTRASLLIAQGGHPKAVTPSGRHGAPGTLEHHRHPGPLRPPVPSPRQPSTTRSPLDSTRRSGPPPPTDWARSGHAWPPASLPIALEMAIDLRVPGGGDGTRTHEPPDCQSGALPAELRPRGEWPHYQPVDRLRRTRGIADAGPGSRWRPTELGVRLWPTTPAQAPAGGLRIPASCPTTPTILWICCGCGRWG